MIARAVSVAAVAATLVGCGQSDTVTTGQSGGSSGAATKSNPSAREETSAYTQTGTFTISIKGETLTHGAGKCTFGPADAFDVNSFAIGGVTYSLEILLNRTPTDGTFGAGPADAVFMLGEGEETSGAGMSKGDDPRSGELTLSDDQKVGTFAFSLDYENDPRRDVTGSFRCG